MRTRHLAALPFAAACWLAANAACAQLEETFDARLTWVPISGSERDDVGGSGSATATLRGTTLVVSGSFDGLPAAASAARLHHGVAVGARGPAIAELNVTRAASGTLDGRVELTPAQVEALRAGKLYLQLHAEQGVAPDNSSLWGWLLHQQRHAEAPPPRRQP